MPSNLSSEGRQKGLDAMHAAPKCQAKRRDGQPCQAAAIRGATRCAKHGGRVEVPDHPANIRRFMDGTLTAGWRHRPRGSSDPETDARGALDSMTWREKIEFLELLDRINADLTKAHEAAEHWQAIQGASYRDAQPFFRRWRNTAVR